MNAKTPRTPREYSETDKSFIWHSLLGVLGDLAFIHSVKEFAHAIQTKLAMEPGHGADPDGGGDRRMLGAAARGRG
ncbi:MAG: hypothetical protein H7Z14_14235 [Anaerolineae bacterium]|nr:hypothetical protein [Phycisphaerae bacterium]